MRRVLIVVYLFPPRGGVGVQRALSFAKYLSREGCHVSVVTARNASTPFYDPGLLKEIPSEVDVRRTFTPELPHSWRESAKLRVFGRSPVQDVNPSSQGAPGSRLKAAIQKTLARLATPDLQRVWVPFALSQSRRVVREKAIDTVIVSVPPFSSLAVGVALKREFPHLILVSDFRDEWLEYTMSQIDAHATDFRRRECERLERDAVEASNYVLSVTPSWVGSIRRRYPEQSTSKFVCIPNGYDEEAFAGFQARPHGSSKLIIGYMGTLSTVPVYSPEAFLHAFDRLPPKVRDHVELRIIGRVTPDAEALLDRCSANIVRLGFLTQSEGFRVLEECDALLVLIGDKTAQSAKLFEYLATGKPVMAVAPRGSEVERIIHETRGGRCVDPADHAGIQAMIQEAWESAQVGRRWLDPPDEVAVSRYSRRSQAKRLMDAIRLARSGASV